jgi:hypothetical protein
MHLSVCVYAAIMLLIANSKDCVQIPLKNTSIANEEAFITWLLRGVSPVRYEVYAHLPKALAITLDSNGPMFTSWEATQSNNVFDFVDQVAWMRDGKTASIIVYICFEETVQEEPYNEMDSLRRGFENLKSPLTGKESKVKTEPVNSSVKRGTAKLKAKRVKKEVSVTPIRKRAISQVQSLEEQLDQGLETPQQEQEDSDDDLESLTFPGPVVSQYGLRSMGGKGKHAV